MEIKKSVRKPEKIVHNVDDDNYEQGNNLELPVELGFHLELRSEMSTRSPLEMM